MVPPYSQRVSRVHWYSGYSWLSRLFAYRIITFFDWTSHSIRLNLNNTFRCPNPKSITTLGLASSAFARHYLRNLSWFLFLSLLRCFSSGGSPHIPMFSVYDDRSFPRPDCSIRKSADIAPTYGSPQLIAVSHVLLRLLVPRHSPCALCSLTFFDNWLRFVIFNYPLSTINYQLSWDIIWFFKLSIFNTRSLQLIDLYLLITLARL